MRRPAAASPAVRHGPFIATAALFLLLIAGCGTSTRDTDAAPVAAPRIFDATVPPAVASAAAPEATRAAEAQFPVPADDVHAVRLVIPSVKVNAPLQIKGVNARNEMENPDGKDNVAWYNFTGRPGFGSNAVFSGHVDWFTGEQGVFWHLRDVKEGDEVMVRLSDETKLTYRVTRVDVWTVSTAPVADIIRPTASETVTLITCDGTFDTRSQEYDKRRVVRAERVS